MPAAVGLVAPIVASSAGAFVSSKVNKGSQQSGEQTVTNKQELDPRIANVLFGSGQSSHTLKPGVTPISGPHGLLNPESDFVTTGDTGLIGNFASYLNKPQDPGLAQYGQANTDYLTNHGAQDMGSMRDAAGTLLAGNVAAPTINSPRQNGLDLSSSYAQMIGGDSAQNPYLTGAIQGGINQSTNAFNNAQASVTRNLLENILPNIRSGSVMSGQYGGSRQGLAEGKAINDFSTQMGQALSQYGQHNTDAAVTAQAGQFDQGQNRSLSAMQGLGGQQYSAANSNLGAQQSTNALNSANTQAGLGAMNGLLGTAYSNAGNQDSYDLNRAGKVSGLLSPFIGVGGSSTQTTPLYQNNAGNAMGGAMTGLGIYNGLKNAGVFGNSDAQNTVANWSQPGYGGNWLFNTANYA